jgi:NADPH2:quinone reductase
MRAAISKSPGGPETLVVEDVPEPSPGADEVLVRVRACGVNYPDLLIIQDKYQVRPERPFSPGGEIAGEVGAIGGNVSGLKIGDRVIGMTGWGGMAECVAVPVAKCIPMPDSMPFEDGAAFISAYGTSYHALKQRGRLLPGEKLLVLGAAGGVGLAAVELGRAMGAQVIAATSTQEKLELALRKGATTGFVYPSKPAEADSKMLSALFKEAAGRAGFDVVYDAVGGIYAEAALRAMAWKGRFLVIGFPSGIPRIALNLTLLKGCEIVGVFYGAFTEKEPEENAANIQELLELYRKGAIKPHIFAVYPLDQAAQAIRDLAERRVQGKVLVAP